MHVVFPDLWQAVPLASPASAMSMALSTSGVSIDPPMRVLPTSVNLIGGLLDVGFIPPSTLG
jgi:hypothetical protein